MRKNSLKKTIFSFACSSMLIAAMALSGCSASSSEETTAASEAPATTVAETTAEVTTVADTTAEVTTVAETTVEDTTVADTTEEVTTAEDATEAAEVTELGEGATSFFFNVTDGEGNETNFKINTDETTVGAALLKLELIAGDESEYGLYVKTVNGVTADWDVDQTYWAFYIDGEYAMTGVDATDITADATYAFVVSK